MPGVVALSSVGSLAAVERSMHEATFVADLAVVLRVAGVTSLLARMARQPTILGYLLAGLIVGPYTPVPVFADHVRGVSCSERRAFEVVKHDFRASSRVDARQVQGRGVTDALVV